MDKMLTYKDIRIYCLVIILSLTLDRCLSQDQDTEARTDPCGAYFVCSTRTVIPDPTDCRVRYECSGVVLTRLQCPEDQEYHSVLQLCVSAGRAACLNPCPDGFKGVRAAYDNGNIAPTVLPSPDSGVEPLVPNPGGDGPTSEEEPYKVDPCAGEFHTQCGKVTTTEYYVFSDPEDCMKYYQCLNGFFYRRDCPAGTRFDKNNHRCVHALSANCLSCPSTTERVTDPPTTPRSHGSDITDLNPCSATLAADCRSLQGEAVIPNPDNCQAYYRCENRKLRQIRCEQSQSFDDVSRSCTPPEEATCFSCQPADSTTAFPPSTLIPPLRQLNPCKTDLEATCEGYPGVSIIPDIHDCNKYFECREGVFDSYKCDKKDIFDVESRSCTAPGQGACFRKEDCPSDEIHPCQSNQAIKAACRDAEFFSLIPDPENCRRYYECKNNNINQKMCKRGFFFDINERICLDDTIAVCVNCTVVDPCSPDIEAQCKTFGQTSDFADVTSCNAFYHCTDGQLDSRSCPAGENFDRLENVCKSAGEADCSDICSGVTTKNTESTTKGGATAQPDVSTAAPSTVVLSTSPLLTTADRGGVVTDPLPSVSMGPISGKSTSGGTSMMSSDLNTDSISSPATSQGMLTKTTNPTVKPSQAGSEGLPTTVISSQKPQSAGTSPLASETTPGPGTTVDSGMSSTVSSLETGAITTGMAKTDSPQESHATTANAEGSTGSTAQTSSGIDNKRTIPGTSVAMVTELSSAESSSVGVESSSGTSGQSLLTGSSVTTTLAITGLGDLNTTSNPAGTAGDTLPTRYWSTESVDHTVTSIVPSATASITDITGSNTTGASANWTSSASSLYSTETPSHTSSGNFPPFDPSTMPPPSVSEIGSTFVTEKTTKSLTYNTSFSESNSTPRGQVSSSGTSTDIISFTYFTNVNTTPSSVPPSLLSTSGDTNITASSLPVTTASTPTLSTTRGQTDQMLESTSVDANATTPSLPVTTDASVTLSATKGQTDQMLDSTSRSFQGQTNLHTASSEIITSSTIPISDKVSSLFPNDTTVGKSTSTESVASSSAKGMIETTDDPFTTLNTEFSRKSTSSTSAQPSPTIAAATSGLDTDQDLTFSTLDPSGTTKANPNTTSGPLTTIPLPSASVDPSTATGFTDPNPPTPSISPSSADPSSTQSTTPTASLPVTTSTLTTRVNISTSSPVSASSREVTLSMRTTSAHDISASSTAWSSQGTDLSTSSPPVNPCFRIEPCTPGVRVPDPEDCDKYFECEDPGRGTENPGWKRRQCTRNYSFDRIRMECVDVVKKGSRCQASCPDPELSLAQVTVEPREGSIVEFQCSYYEPMSSTNPPKFPRFRWTLDGQNIRGGKGRIFITTAPATSDGYRTSHLIFNPAKYQDSGEVACRVQGTTPKAFVQSVRYAVLARPVAFVSPMTSVVPRGKIVNLFCNGSIPESGHSGAMINPTLNWYRNGRLVTKGQPETITPFHSFSNLKVEVFDDVSYSCEAVNAAGPSARMRADVFVYNVSSGDTIVFCKEELADNVMWPRTSAGIEVRSGCPTGMIGVAVRRCNEVDDDVDDDEDHVEAEWGPPNLIGCVTREVTELLERSKNIEEGVGSDNSSFIANLVYDIEYNTDKSGIIPPGDISATVETVDYLAVVRQENADTTDLMYEELQAMVNIVSNLIDDMNEESWSVLQSSEADMHKGIDLMRAVDGYADVMAGQTQLIGLLSAMSKNLMLQVECILKNETGTLVYPRRGKEETIWLGDQHDQISLEKNTLDSIMNKVRGKSMAFASAYYKGLSSVIPDSAEYGEIGSNILSLSIARLLGVKNLDPPVRLEMNIDKALVDQNLTARCGFWDFSKGVRGNWSTEGCEVVYSNDSFASCQCDHLTNFAILMSTHKPDDKHAEILSIITTVGLIVSLVCLVLTIGLYCVLWKHIKSHHAVVLINLCIALIIANVLFLAGVHQTKIKLMCTIISVLLHYFYLAAFFIMLVEGIQLLLYVVFVFHVRRKRETTMLLIFGWFLPAAVVGASLGITKMEGYGNEYFCWLDIDSGLIWAFVGPVLCIIFVNIIILIVVLRRASASNANLRIEKKKRHRIRSSFWNIVVITPIVGVAWIFGVFAVNQDTLAFQYIFAIFNSLQGLLIFIFHGIFNKRKGRYSVKHPSTKRSRLKSDTSGKNANKVNKNSKGSSVPSSPGTEPPNLFPMKTEGDNKDTLSELREDNHMSWRNSNVFYSNGMSTFGGSDISNQTNSTLVNSTESNGTQPHTTSNSESQDSGVGVSSADIKADIKETERPDPREPVQRVLSSTSC